MERVEEAEVIRASVKPEGEMLPGGWGFPLKGKGFDKRGHFFISGGGGIQMKAICRC